MGQQRHRRFELGVLGQLHQVVGLGRALDEHDVGAETFELGSQGPRRPRPVVPDPQHGDAHGRPRPRGARTHRRVRDR
ncbi:hypothetical protein ACFQX6_63260 [Streptosporangium lutulentum]